MINLRKRHEVFKRAQKLTLSSFYALLAPVVLWFSYQPALEFGATSGMHLKISLPLLYLTGFVVLFANAPKAKGTLIGDLLRKKSPLYFGLRLPLLFTTYALLSLLWAQNRLRGEVEVGVLLMLMCAYVLILTKAHEKEFWQRLVKVLFATSLLMSSLAVFQVLWGAFSNWGLCRGCLASGFGFARPSLFAIEPQFFGSLLLAPTLLLFYKFIRKETRAWEIATLLLSCTAIFLTLSRGAIYALLGGGFVMLVVFLIQACKDRGAERAVQQMSQGAPTDVPLKTSPEVLKGILPETFPKLSNGASIGVIKRALASVGCVLLAFALSLSLDTLAVALNAQVHENPLHAPAKIISQLTLGKVELQRERGEGFGGADGGKGDSDGDGTAFDGYVEASTNERKSSTRAALEVYTSSPVVMLFGVGAGSSGAALQEAGKVSNFEIVQNQYVSTLLDLGAVGLVIFISIFASLCVFLLGRKDTAPLVSICIAFLLQWYFFSGFPNALHVYFALALLASWRLSNPPAR